MRFSIYAVLENGPNSCFMLQYSHIMRFLVKIIVYKILLIFFLHLCYSCIMRFLLGNKKRINGELSVLLFYLVTLKVHWPPFLSGLQKGRIHPYQFCLDLIWRNRDFKSRRREWGVSNQAIPESFECAKIRNKSSICTTGHWRLSVAYGIKRWFFLILFLLTAWHQESEPCYLCIIVLCSYYLLYWFLLVLNST